MVKKFIFTKSITLSW